MDMHQLLPLVAQVDDVDDPGAIVEMLALGPFAAGVQPAARTVRLQRVRPDARLSPPDTEPARVVVDGGTRRHLTTGDGWTLWAVVWRDRTAMVTVTATTEQLAHDVLRAALDGAVEEKPPSAEAATVGFWHSTRCGAKRADRVVAISPWAEIRRNYASSVGSALERLMGLTSEDLSGRLMLFHGPPGTGKTTALRALAHAWRSWCRMEYVLDPEQLLRDSGYLMGVLLGDDDDFDDDDAGRPTWRLLVLEDCDELIRADAKLGSGQALSRLLTLTDGLLGQGLEVLVCISTNEDLARLHPAIVRRGRCFAQIHVPRLPRCEAIAWLGRSDGIGAEGATLAELYALQGGHEQLEASGTDRVPGLYL